MEMNFCRRCGAEFKASNDHAFKCQSGHTIYANASPAVALILENSFGQMVVLTRGINPGKGSYDLPGGFCDGAETLEAAIARETKEEIGIDSSSYTKPQLVATGIDNYEFGSEHTPVLSCVFYAQLLDDTAVLRPADDAATAEFMDADDDLVNAMYFDSLKQALRTHLQQR